MALSGILAAASASAQSIHVGGKLGLARATQTHQVGGVTEFSGDRQSVYAGIALRVDLAQWLAVQTEVLYAEKGFDEGRDFEMRMRYIEVPLLLRYTSSFALRGVRPVLLAGVAGALEVSCAGWTVPGHIHLAPDPVPLDCASMRSDRSDWGVVAGAGLETRIAGVTLTAEARYTDGRRDLASVYEFVEVKNRAVSLLLEATVQLRE